MDRDPKLNVDEARILPRYRDTSPLLERHRLRRQQAIALAEAASVTPLQKRVVKAEPGDLRGIPVIGAGVGGASPGTSPHTRSFKLGQAA